MFAPCLERPWPNGGRPSDRPPVAAARRRGRSCSIVGYYLPGFTRACASARDRIYLDVFAGCGRGEDPRTGELYAGSAALAFGIEPGFTEIYLIEEQAKRVGELKELARGHPNAHILHDDANIAIPPCSGG